MYWFKCWGEGRGYVSNDLQRIQNWAQKRTEIAQVSFAGVRVSDKVGRRRLSLVFRVESGLRECRSRCCRRSLWPSSAWRRRYAWSAAASSALLSSDGPRGPGTSPWWVGYVHLHEAPPGPLTHLQQPHPRRYRPGGCHSPHLLASLVREEEASYPPSPVTLRRRYEEDENGQWSYRVRWYKKNGLCEGDPMQKSGDIGRREWETKRAKTSTKRVKFKWGWIVGRGITTDK